MSDHPVFTYAFARTFGISVEEAREYLSRFVATLNSPVTGGRYWVYPDGVVLRIPGRKPLLHKGGKARRNRKW